jgi:hypothetical protein
MALLEELAIQVYLTHWMRFSGAQPKRGLVGAITVFQRLR